MAKVVMSRLEYDQIMESYLGITGLKISQESIEMDFNPKLLAFNKSLFV